MKKLPLIATLLVFGLPVGAWAAGAITPKVGNAGADDF